MNVAVAYGSVVVELRHYRATGSDLFEDAVAGATDVILHVSEGLFQTIAIRRELALERDDFLVTYIHFYCRHRSFSSIPSPAPRSVCLTFRAGEPPDVTLYTARRQRA